MTTVHSGRAGPGSTRATGDDGTGAASDARDAAVSTAAHATESDPLSRTTAFTRVVEALVELHEAGQEAPSARAIADRSGIAVRTVLLLMQDPDALYGAALRHQSERRSSGVAAVPSGGGLATRANALVRTRVQHFEAIAPLWRAASRLSADSSAVSAELARQRRELDAPIATVFEPELRAIARPDRAAALAAVELACSLETWDQVRRQKGLSVAESAKVVVMMLEGVLRE